MKPPLVRKPLALRLNITIAVSAFLTNAFLAFVSYRLVLEIGGTTLLGLWSALLSATFLIRIGDLGVGAAAVRYIAILPDDATIQALRNLIDTIVLINVAQYTLLATVGFHILYQAFPLIVGDTVNIDAIPNLRSVLAVLMAGFAVQGIAGALLSVLQGLYVGYISSIITVVGLLIQLVFVIILVPEHGLIGFAWALLIQNISVLLISWTQIVIITRSAREGLVPIRFCLLDARKTITLGLFIHASNIVNGLFEPAAKLLIARYCGFAALGNFELAYRSVHLIRGALNSAVLATIPAGAKFIETNRAAARDLYLKMKRRAMNAMGLCAIIIILASPILSFLWLEKIDVSFIISIILVTAGVVGNFNGAPAYTLGMASGKLTGNVISSVIALALLFILVPIGATNGPLLAIAATAIAMTAGGTVVKHLNERIVAKAI